MAAEVRVAAYYFPEYHADPHNDRWHGTGWTEWDLVKRAEPRYPGHRQPRQPLWGYGDEADPNVQAVKIDAAADHGLSAWIWDWYWYEDGPFLNRALDQGYLSAPNRDRLSFALMWANHDWLDIHPAKRQGPPQVLLPGVLSPAAFARATGHITEHYFTRSNYWRVGGGLYFSIYEVMNLVRSLGDLTSTRRAFDNWRNELARLGLGPLHLNAVVWGLRILQTEHKIEDVNQVVSALGFDSVTSYVWIHHQPLNCFPETDYTTYARLASADWRRFRSEYHVPYYPNVTMGWDASPRTVQSDRYDPVGYPFMATLGGNSPDAFKQSLVDVRAFLEEDRTQPAILTINAWNEWTEGSYVEPDTEYGLGYLQAIKQVFGRNTI
jgi:hypothetical protein